MLDRRQRRRPNIKSALVYRVAFAGDDVGGIPRVFSPCYGHQQTHSCFSFHSVGDHVVGVQQHILVNASLEEALDVFRRLKPGPIKILLRKSTHPHEVSKSSYRNVAHEVSSGLLTNHDYCHFKSFSYCIK